MIMLIKLLGPGYKVWAEAATIRFKRPGRITLYARFFLSDAELSAIGDELASKPSVNRTCLVELADRDGVVHAPIGKVVHIRAKTKGSSVNEEHDWP
jgi:hypothetical protein